MNIDVDIVRKALAARPYRPAPLEAGDGFAAVAAVLRERSGAAEVLLIRRSSQEGDPWSGHMAFPGGRQAPTDPDLVATAVRETEEEVGLHLRPAELVGRLDDLPAVARGRRAGLVIAPFVFVIDADPVLVPNAKEVDETVWAPLTPLADGARDTAFAYEFEGRTVALPAYDVSGRVVWGLTHRMLGALFEALDGRPRGGSWS